MQIFDVCKKISAAEIARREGIILKKRGTREWTCCPLHGEKTASLMFDDAGNWHCFGCGKGGDAVSFYAAMHKVTAYDAAKIIAKSFGVLPFGGITHNYLPASISPARQLMTKVEEWYLLQWNMACVIKHLASALINEANTKWEEDRLADRPFFVPDDFYQWVKAEADAEYRLDMLQLSDTGERIRMMWEERHEHMQDR